MILACIKRRTAAKTALMYYVSIEDIWQFTANQVSIYRLYDGFDLLYEDPKVTQSSLIPR